VRTTLVFIALPDVNHPQFIFYRNPGADLMIRPDDVDKNLFKSICAFHFGSLSLVDEPARSATQEALKLAHEVNAFVSYDVNYRPNLWKSPDEAIKRAREMLPMINLIKVNEVELKMLSESNQIENACSELLAAGPELIVVTMGEQGSYFSFRNGTGFVPAFHVNTVDATGCGDAFIAGLLHRMINSMNWRSMLNKERMIEILTYANAVGALTSMKMGVIPSLPFAKEVDDFLEAHS
jgi:fructokinase